MAHLTENQTTERDERKPTLCVVALSCNEEVDLPGFLDNVLPWVDEVVIVDDDSTDQTVEIIERAVDKVKLVRHAMTSEGGFAEQRNMGIAAATCDWVLNMDIDERGTPQLAMEIRRTIRDTQLNAFRYHRLNFFLHRPMRGGGWDSWNRPQLARWGCHRYENKIHERCVVDGEPASIGQLQSFMWHLNDDGYEERMRKSLQYSKLEADKISLKDVRVTWVHILFNPCCEFAKKYFLKQGLRDGVPGLIASLHSASAVFRQYALVWDQQNSLDRSVLEERLKKMWNDQNG